LEAGYEPTKQPTRHIGDVLAAPDPHAVKENPHGVKPNEANGYKTADFTFFSS
jgi:hypothetical protein